MPIYEYQCQKCGYKFEELQSISEKPLQVCPECKAKALQKLVSQTSFRLKGSGWYETDFKDKKTETKSKAVKASGDTKTETKSKASDDK